jgi:unsaturated rhamnogalacturonyl hydrolase
MFRTTILILLSGNVLFYTFMIMRKRKSIIKMTLQRSSKKIKPRTASGGFWHNKPVPIQMWVDGFVYGRTFFILDHGWICNGDFFGVIIQFSLVHDHFYR